MSTKLLICDDSNMARKQLARSLPDGWDVDVSFATNGVEGVAAIKEGKLTAGREFEDTIATALAAGILTQEETDSLLAAEEARLDAIQVDDYSQEYIAGNFEKIPEAKNVAA